MTHWLDRPGWVVAHYLYISSFLTYKTIVSYTYTYSMAGSGAAGRFACSSMKGEHQHLHKVAFLYLVCCLFSLFSRFSLSFFLFPFS
jgi:hypothetical protein